MPDPRRLALLLSAALVTVLAVGCGSDPGAGGDGDPSRAAEGVDVRLDARVDVADGAVAITYTATNEGDDPVALLNLMADDGDLSSSGWATLDAGNGVAEIAQRALPRPDDFEGAEQPTVGVTDLDPGESAEAELSVPLPLEDHGPYAAFGQEAPSDPDRVRLCVGALEDRGDLPISRTGPPDGTDGQVSHVAAYADAQAVICSEPVELP